MAKAKNPITFCAEFGVDPDVCAKLGVLDPTLAIDTNLFVDPLLLGASSHAEIRGDAVRNYNSRFEQIIGLLAASKGPGDVAWRASVRLFSFPEVRGTCLGYGAGSIHGSGMGPKLTARLLGTAKDIVDIGIRDPALFAALALIEEGVGPDRISDMTTNIILPALARFNGRILEQLGLRGEDFQISGMKGQFLRNPYERDRTPVVLLPTDILRELPIANDWDSVCDAAAQNDALRADVNQYIAELWEAKTLRDKAELKAESMSSKEAFNVLLSAIKGAAGNPYDVARDPDGLIQWAIRGQRFADENPLELPREPLRSVDDVMEIVRLIIKQFRHLIERAGLNKELYSESRKPRHESSAQRLFFAVAYAYCKANNVDVSPEIDTGNGKIDFKFSTGFDQRVLCEIKLSTNKNAVGGYRNQLEEYKASQETTRAVYLVIDVGGMGRKEYDLIQMRNDRRRAKDPVSDLEFVSGLLKDPPSKLR